MDAGPMAVSLLVHADRPGVAVADREGAVDHTVADAARPGAAALPPPNRARPLRARENVGDKIRSPRMAVVRAQRLFEVGVLTVEALPKRVGAVEDEVEVLGRVDAPRRG